MAFDDEDIFESLAEATSHDDLEYAPDRLRSMRLLVRSAWIPKPAAPDAAERKRAKAAERVRRYRARRKGDPAYRAMVREHELAYRATVDPEVLRAQNRARCATYYRLRRPP